jgi:hypothetical protein
MAAVAATTAISCAGADLAGHPLSRPSGNAASVVYTVGQLSFEAPVQWQARGGATRVQVQPTDERAMLEVRRLERTFDNQAVCLRDAEDSLARGATELQNVRRHSTMFAGHRAVTQEADQGPWHGWAYAVCHGGVQYRVFFSGRSPMRGEDLEAWRGLVANAQLAALR